jgi:molecular chaperone DnaK (HSP70)
MGNHYLGGADWDNKIIEFFMEEFHKQTKEEISEEQAEDKSEFDEFVYQLRLESVPKLSPPYFLAY